MEISRHFVILIRQRRRRISLEMLRYAQHDGTRGITETWSCLPGNTDQPVLKLELLDEFLGPASLVQA
ncbi:MAG: hypothetical protein ABH891_07985 [Candidatus Omnitrophota bacterium]